MNLLPPHVVDSTSALHPVELCWLSACGLRRGSKVSPSMDRPPGTVCRLHYEQQSCHRTPSHARRRTCSQPPGTIETFLRDFDADYKCTFLLTDLAYLLIDALFWAASFRKQSASKSKIDGKFRMCDPL